MTFTWGEISVAGIIILCVGIFFGHYFAYKRDRRKEFIDAGKDFREAFTEVRILLDIKPPNDPAISNEWQKTWKLLERFYKQHRAAIRRFEDILPSFQKASFRKCWEEYCCYDKKNNCKTFSYYKSESMEEEFNKRQLAISRIEKLLKFAN